MMSTPLYAYSLQDCAWPKDEGKMFQSRKSANRQKKKKTWLKKLDKSKKRNERTKQSVLKEKPEKRLIQNKEPLKGRKLSKKQQNKQQKKKEFDFVCRWLFYVNYGVPMDSKC